MTAGNGTEFMTVYPFKDNPFSVQSHDPVFHLKSPETYTLRDIFLKFPCSVIYLNREIIELRILRTPQNRIFDLHGNAPILQVKGSLESLSVFCKADFRFSFSPGFCADLQAALCQGLVRNGPDSQIPDMYIRHGIKINIPVDS